MGDPSDPKVLKLLIPHVFIPPQLPQQAQDDEERDISMELCRLLIKSVIAYRQNVPPEEIRQWNMAERMLKSVRGFVEAPMSSDGLSRALRNMRVGDVLPLHIHAQNAVVVVYKQAKGSAFAVHEASPANAAVYSTTGKLLITFPGPAVYLPVNVVGNTSFISNLSLFLSHMDVDLIDTPHTTKAGSSVAETRDTVDPRYITQLLLGILHGCEGASNADVRRHQKRVAEEVTFHDALKPWRRLPLWLIIRSTLQTTLSSNVNYKAFMVFFLTRFMTNCLTHESGFPSDLFYVMRAKVARRLGKLEPGSCPEFVLRAAEECVRAAQDVLQRRWTGVEEERRQQAPWVAPLSSSLAANTKLSLNNSQSFLLDALQRNDANQIEQAYNPLHRARFAGEQDFLRFKNNSLAHAVAGETPIVALADFEACVRRSLFAWVDDVAVNGVENACACLHTCFQQYQAATKKHYSEKNPHDQSLAVLTLLAIWTAMDRLAVRAHPLLARYSPEIPPHFLEPLLLQGADNIQLASDIEQHIHHRHATVHLGAISVFEELPHSSSFASQMYDQDTSFAKVRASIEHDAQNERDMKVAEMHTINERYSTLLEEVESLEHTNISRMAWVYGEYVSEEYHSQKDCERCRLKKEAGLLSIQAHEWPLPSDELSLQLVVFELTCPLAYSFWREMTYMVLTSVGRVSSASSASSKKCERLLRAYNPLSSYASARDSPITVGSRTKAFIDSHYRAKTVPAEESDVCLNNALQFRPFHSLDRAWLSAPPLSRSSVAHLCAPQLPADSLYGHLQFALERTIHSSNGILADQASCPQTLTIHEHLSFASLRSGGRLQWLNIARELRARTLSLSRDEVHHLIAQTIWQLGPLCDGNREWHIDLKDTIFCLRLLDESSSVLESIGENWKERLSVYTIVLIALRVLDTCPDISVQSKAREILIAARRIISAIRDSLWKRLSKVRGSARPSAQRLVCEAAAICVSTYDASVEHIAAFLGSTGGDNGYELFRSIVLVQENAPLDTSQMPLHTQYILRRHERILHRLEDELRAYIVAEPSGLHRAVASLWSTYHADGTPWTHLPAPNHRHLHRSFEAQGRSQSVHLNLLSGKLLVNGQPLGRLPTDITCHPTFRRIFGQSTILEVVPTADPGMQYETRGAVFGWTIFFALHPGEELTVRARRANAIAGLASSTFQLIPHSIFQGDPEDDLPHFLIHDHAHWLDLDSGTVEFRPLQSRWSENTHNWCLAGLQEDHPLLGRGQSSLRLIDVRSPAFHAVHSCLGALELATFTVVTYDGERLRAELPRFRLSFFMNDDGDLESLNYRDTLVDKNQAAHGTFFGLQNQLVLKRKGDDLQTLPRSRRVLVPDGKVHYEWEETSAHASVTIRLGEDVERILFHEFVVDDDLGRLTGASTMTTRLFQALLHAVTSGCLCDPLTGLTGTEQALRQLNEARIFSFKQLASRELELLREIAALTPDRAFYPAHLRVMQKITWKDLSPLSQCAGFKLAVDDILSYARNLDAFIPHTSPWQTATDGALASAGHNHDLLERAARRGSQLYPPGTPFSSHTRRFEDDLRHHARQSLDSEAYSIAEQSVARTSRVIQSPSGSLKYSDMDIMTVFEPSKDVSGRGILTLLYSPQWLRACDVADEWSSLYRLCTEFHDDNGRNRYQLLFTFTSFVFTKPHVEPLMRLLLALCLNDRVRSERPDWLIVSPAPKYTLANGVQPRIATVSEQLRHLIRPSSEVVHIRNMKRLPGESKRAYKARKNLEHETRSSSSIQLLASHFIEHWPAINLSLKGLPTEPDIPGDWLNISAQSLAPLRTYFRSCLDNSKFSDHIQRVEIKLRSSMAQDHPDAPLVPLSAPDSVDTSAISGHPVSLVELLKLREPPAEADINMATDYEGQMPAQSPLTSDYQPLHALLTRLEGQSVRGILREYLPNLKESLAHLVRHPSAPLRSALPPPKNDLKQYRDVCMQQLRETWERLRESLASSPGPVHDSSGIWPRVTPTSLLQLLCRVEYEKLSTSWRRALVEYGRMILVYQRAQRLFEFSLRNMPEDVLKEMQNVVNDVTSLVDEPDWILIQIEANFLSRPLQRTIAHEMMAPSAHQNSLLQLNMGEGKSSVIVPFTVAALADGNALVRVVVLKALSNQMFDVLVDRLGGLANRRIFYVPFSRDVPMSLEAVAKLRNMYEQCVRVRGVIVIQPEHILSFRLTSHELLMSAVSNRQTALSNSLRDLQEWMEAHSRDVLDESDELLHARYQLLYTVGQPKPVDDHPHRWATIQQVLSVLRSCMGSMQTEFPSVISYHPRSDSAFAHIRLQTSAADDAIRRAIIDRILDGGLPNLLFSTLSSTIREKIRHFIIHHPLASETYANVRYELDGSGLWPGVLLLRGLLAPNTGVLFYILRERRWRVDFGLDPTRTLMAVPYRAKDVPSIKAEFGHPDVAITLTYFSYYYGGLTTAQVAQCFSRLFSLEDPQREYSDWVSVGGSDIPAYIRELSGVNVEDEEHVDAVLGPTFSFNRAVVDFYLAHIVFPREAREFPQKLGTSAWDLAEPKPRVTTGFSGTKDNRFLLPSSISQTDLSEQRGTDAMVLSYVLQPENHYTAYTGPQSGEGFLRFIASQGNDLRVLLDVGAQMLDMKNQELAALWLPLCDPTVQAAIFFTDTDDLVVLTRDGTVEDFRSSPYSEQLDKCIAYLDDAHTRGTDLKLPSHYRAVLTLGPKVTKDRLVQGAMRMRKLGHGQSLLLVAPREIDSAIRSSARLPEDAVVGISDVIQWAIMETCADIRHHLSHWAAQGVDYKARHDADTEYTQKSNLSILQRTWLQPEARTLDQMYGTTSSLQGERLWERAKQHQDIAKRLTDLGVSGLESAHLSEEQEREVVLEVEREQQVQRPPRVQAAPEPVRVHEDLVAFVQSGNIPLDSDQYASLFEPIEQAGDEWDKRLLCSRDFLTTVAPSDAESLPALHDYMRPVVWVLSSGLHGSPEGIRLVALSPFEANQLLPSIRSNTSGVYLHVFSHRPFKSTSTLSDLHFHTVPPLRGSDASVPLRLRDQLRLWAGELWLESHAAYKRLCTFLCLYMGLSADDIGRLREGGYISGDGFVRVIGHTVIQDTDVTLLGFHGSVVDRLRKLYALRRKGVPYLSTHIGRILNTRELAETEWEE